MYSEYNSEGTRALETIIDLPIGFPITLSLSESERFNHTYITTYGGERQATIFNCIGTLSFGFVCTHEREIEGEEACAYAPLTIRCPKLHRETWSWLVLAGAQHVVSPVTIQYTQKTVGHRQVAVTRSRGQLSHSPHFQCLQNQTPASRSLSPSLTYFKHLQRTSLSLYALQAPANHHTLLSLPLPLSLTYFKHLQRTSLSLCALQAL